MEKYTTILIKSICIFLLSIENISGSRLFNVELGGLNFVSVTPRTQQDLNTLKQIRESNSGLIFLNGIGNLDQVSYILGSPIDIEKAIDFDHKSRGSDSFWTQTAFNSLFDQDDDEHRLHKLKIEFQSSKESDTNNLPPSQNPNTPQPQSLSLLPKLQKTSSRDFSPIKHIPGTNLFTGIFYTVGLKRFPQGWVTWTFDNTTRREGNYVQINNVVKDRPLYTRGEQWYPDIHWSFETSEKPGYYTFRNKHDTTALTSTLQEKPQDNGYTYLIITRDRNLKQKLSNPNDTERSSALWKPKAAVGTGLSNYYSLLNLKYPDDVISWTETKYRDVSHYLQVSRIKDHRVKYQNEWMDDKLFRFDLPDIKLEGVVNNLNFDFTPTVLSQFKNTGLVTRTNFTELSWTNYGSTPQILTFKAPITWKNNFTLTFDQDLSKFTKVKVGLSLPTFTSSSSIIPFQTEIDVDLDNLDSAKYTIEQKQWFQTDVEFLPGKGRNVESFIDTVKDIEIPFKGVMNLRALTDRMLRDYSGSDEGVVPLNVVRDILDKAGFDVDKEFGENDVSEFLIVTGKLKAEYVIDFGLITEEL